MGQETQSKKGPGDMRMIDFPPWFSQILLIPSSSTCTNSKFLSTPLWKPCCLSNYQTTNHTFDHFYFFLHFLSPHILSQPSGVINEDNNTGQFMLELTLCIFSFIWCHVTWWSQSDFVILIFLHFLGWSRIIYWTWANIRTTSWRVFV